MNMSCHGLSRCRSPLIALFLASAVACAGCGDNATISLVPVTGHVTLDDTPAAGATIRFIPVDGRRKDMPASSAVIDKDGNYALRAPGGHPGAIPGEFIVTIECPMVLSDPTQKGPKTPCAVPAKYGSLSTTDQKATITRDDAKKGEPRKIDFKLTSK